jgi:hypothetical protein
MVSSKEGKGSGAQLRNNRRNRSSGAQQKKSLL